ncbi:MAG: hypothetical protein V1743_01800 [Nanoarchaeota archaeon]
MIITSIDQKVPGSPKINFQRREIYLTVNQETVQHGIICKYSKEENTLRINKDSILDQEGALEMVINDWHCISFFNNGVTVSIDLGRKDPQNPFIYTGVKLLTYLPDGYGQNYLGGKKKNRLEKIFSRYCIEIFSD